jgi:dUTP pyrophosphatase
MIDTGAGVIDADYRGVIFVLLFNHSDDDFQGKIYALDSDVYKRS